MTTIIDPSDRCGELVAVTHFLLDYDVAPTPNLMAMLLAQTLEPLSFSVILFPSDGSNVRSIRPIGPQALHRVELCNFDWCKGALTVLIAPVLIRASVIYFRHFVDSSWLHKAENLSSSANDASLVWFQALLLAMKEAHRRDAESQIVQAVRPALSSKRFCANNDDDDENEEKEDEDIFGLFPELVSLRIEQCAMSPMSLQLFSRKCWASHLQLLSICLGNNINFTSAHFMALLPVLRGSTALQTLILFRMSVSDATFQTMALLLNNKFVDEEEVVEEMVVKGQESFPRSVSVLETGTERERAPIQAMTFNCGQPVDVHGEGFRKFLRCFSRTLRTVSVKSVPVRGCSSTPRLAELDLSTLLYEK